MIDGLIFKALATKYLCHICVLEWTKDSARADANYRWVKRGFLSPLQDKDSTGPTATIFLGIEMTATGPHYVSLLPLANAEQPKDLLQAKGKKRTLQDEKGFLVKVPRRRGRRREVGVRHPAVR